MGYGDKLMAIGDAWAQHQSDPLKRKVAIGDGTRLDTTDVDLTWGLDHFLATPETFDPENQTWALSWPGRRPYIDYALMRETLAQQGMIIEKTAKLVQRLGRYIWKPDYRASPAPFVLTVREQEIADSWRARGPFAVLEPFVKMRAPPSKQWPVDRFAAAGRLISKQVPVFQVVGPNRPTLPGFRPIRTESFRDAVAVLSAASLYVGPEGGLHHASAAVGTRAVVVFGGFISPEVTGYANHANLTGGATHFCGTRFRLCPHCVEHLSNITPQHVALAARAILETP
jgi:ADP-heptose:LPS heptosyltransferase